MWFSLAAGENHEMAKENLARLEALLTEEEIRKAKGLSRECLEKGYIDC